MEFSPGKPIKIRIQFEAGALRSDDPTKYHGFTNADADINATPVYEVHGHWDGPDSQAATLFVIRFDLSSSAKTRTFRFFAPTMTFRAASTEPKKNLLQKMFSFGSSTRSSTEVGAIPRIADKMREPGAGGKVILSEIKCETEKSSSIQPAVGITAPPPVPVNASVTYTKTDQKTYQETFRYEISSGVRSSVPRSKKDNEIYYNAWQHKKYPDGIDVVQVAFVVFRAGEDDFEFDLDLDASADFTYNLTNSISGKSRALVKINPKNASATQEVPDGIDPHRLKKLKENDNEALKKLTHVHVPEVPVPATRA